MGERETRSHVEWWVDLASVMLNRRVKARESVLLFVTIIAAVAIALAVTVVLQ
jgi:hypothetical protein